MMASFKHRNKDFVFLVNINKSMGDHLERVQNSLKQIFDKGLEDNDRISLITYSKNSRIIFSLVEKERNFTQLRNQIERIEPYSKSPSNLYKALKECIKEFKDYQTVQSKNSQNPEGQENQRYILLLTNELGEDNQKRIRREDIITLLKQYEVTLLVLGFDMDSHSKGELERISRVCNEEGRVLNNPNPYLINEMFLSITNYRFQNSPLILETFS